MCHCVALHRVNNVHRITINFVSFFFIYLAIVPHKLNTMARVNFTGAKITHINTHFNCLIYISFTIKMICYFFANRSHVEQRIKKNHIYGDSNEGVKNDFRYDGGATGTHNIAYLNSKTNVEYRFYTKQFSFKQIQISNFFKKTLF